MAKKTTEEMRQMLHGMFNEALSKKVVREQTGLCRQSVEKYYKEWIADKRKWLREQNIPNLHLSNDDDVWVAWLLYTKWKWKQPQKKIRDERYRLVKVGEKGALKTPYRPDGIWR
jgi:hypothetical protein